MPNHFPKVLNSSDLKLALEFYRSQNKKIVFTNGCFDLIHIGHVRYLEQAHSLADILIVGINSDLSVKKLKGPERPIQSENDRAEILASLKAVDHTVIFSEDTPLRLIQEIRPDLLVKGGDWKLDQIVGSDFVLSYQGQVKSLQFINDRSTTALINKSKT